MLRLLGLGRDEAGSISEEDIRMLEAESHEQGVIDAHERDMVVVALTGRGGGELARMLRETDVHVGVPQEGVAHIHEAHQLVLHALCDGLDIELLGEEEIAE